MDVSVWHDCCQLSTLSLPDMLYGCNHSSKGNKRKCAHASTASVCNPKKLLKLKNCWGLQPHFIMESAHSRLSFLLVSLEGAFNIKLIKNSWQWTNLMVTYYNIVWFTQRCINYKTSESRYRLVYLLWLLESDSFDRNKFLNSHSLCITGFAICLWIKLKQKYSVI